MSYTITLNLMSPIMQATMLADILVNNDGRELYRWLEENMEGRWRCDGISFNFEEEADATLFRLMFAEDIEA